MCPCAIDLTMRIKGWIVSLSALSLIFSYYSLYDAFAFIVLGDCHYEEFQKEDDFNGVYRHYSSVGSLLYEMNFKNGQLDGIYKTYRSDGTLACEILFEDGQEINISEHDLNGNPIVKSSVDRECYLEADGVPENLIGESVFLGQSYEERCNRSQPEGLNQCIDKQSEQILLEWICREHRLEGIAKWYYQDGALKREHFYEKGRLQFIKNYYSNGIVMGEYHFNNGQRSGIAKEYFENGNLKKESQIDMVTKLDNFFCCENVKEYSPEGVQTDEYHFEFEIVDSKACEGDKFITRKLKNGSVIDTTTIEAASPCTM